MSDHIAVFERLYYAGKKVVIMHQLDRFPVGSPYAAELRDRAETFNAALEAARAALGLCDPDRGTHFHGSGDRCECGELPNTSRAGDSFLQGPAREPVQPATEEPAEGKDG